MGARATGEPGDVAAAAPQDQPLQFAMKWWPGAPACRSRHAPSGGSSQQSAAKIAASFRCSRASGNSPRCCEIVEGQGAAVTRR
jgi:hypothetical protein